MKTLSESLLKSKMLKLGSDYPKKTLYCLPRNNSGAKGFGRIHATKGARWEQFTLGNSVGR